MAETEENIKSDQSEARISRLVFKKKIKIKLGVQFQKP